ncbi:hypothetical protein BDFB_008526 [Asbolus verrucosus]|uniref:Uncharacterized protein n=1 Tax=Asbolus verrucosus TaxID=1661398 RepID=A0A482VZP1_ASBVE|nr:hypothetical protein BDFB_008526 [Asbolus verrucosus]
MSWTPFIVTFSLITYNGFVVRPIITFFMNTRRMPSRISTVKLVDKDGNKVGLNIYRKLGTYVID